MAFKLGSGIAETTTTTGTGSITLGGAVSGYLSFADGDIAVNDSTFYRIDNPAGSWEVGVGTRTGTSTLSRDTILRTHTGGTSPVNFGSGTKTVTCVLPGEVAAVTNQVNTFTAAQQFNGQEVRLNAANDSYIIGGVSGGTEYVDLYVDGEFVARFTTAGLRIISDDAGATAEPQIVFDRNSSSPADDDVQGKVYFRGRDSGGNSCDYATIRGEAADVTDATEDGRLVIATKVAGNDIDSLTVDGATLYCEETTAKFLVGKTASSGSTAGVELEGGGVLRVTRSGANMATFNRLASIGSIMAFQYADSTKGSIEVSTTATTYNTTSDRRWKRDIVPFEDGLEIVLRLQPVEYGWVDEPGAPREVGLIAQDTVEVIPQIVNRGATEDEPWRMDYGRLAPWLVSAIHKLNARIAELERRVGQ